MANRFSELGSPDPNDVTRDLRRSVDRLIGRLQPKPDEHAYADQLGQMLFGKLLAHFDASPSPKLPINVPATLAVAALRADLWATHMEEGDAWEVAHPRSVAAFDPEDRSVVAVKPPEDRASAAIFDKIYEAIAAGNESDIELAGGDVIAHRRSSDGRWAFAFRHQGSVVASGVVLAAPNDAERDEEVIAAAERLTGSPLPAGVRRAASGVKRRLAIVAYQCNNGHRDMAVNSVIFQYLEAVFGYRPEKDAEDRESAQEAQMQIETLLSQLGIDGAMRGSVLQRADAGFKSAVRMLGNVVRDRHQFLRYRVVTLAFGLAFANAEAWYKMQPPPGASGA